MVKRKTIAIIPARGGSRRLPHKNIMPFEGKPLIAWTIEAARESGLLDRILVSTDNPEIAAVAREYGVEVPFLRDSCADDHSPVSEATLRALDQTEQQLGETYDIVVQLMANCPLRGADDIRRAHNNFVEQDASFQISCFKFGWMNPWWAVRLDEQSRPEPLFPDARQQRSQDLDPLYCPTGAIWIARVESLRHAGTFYGPSHIFFPMDWRSAMDIDDMDDFNMATTMAARPVMI